MRYFLEVLVVATGTGVLWRSFFDFGYSFIFLLFLLGIGVIFILGRRGALIALFFFVCGLGIFRTDIYIENIDKTSPEHYGKTTIEGVVVNEPDLRDNSQHVVVKEGDTKIRVTLPLSHTLSYGTKVHLEGELERPTSFQTETGREFHYDAWLKKDGITGVMYFPRITVVGEGEGNVVKRFLFSAKKAFLLSLARVIPEPEVSLLGGLVVGAKEALGEDLLERFRDTGLIHIVVLSGYNVSIIAEWLLRALGFLPRFIGIGVGAVAISLFAIMTGGSATVVRASVMALIILLSRVVSRPYQVFRTLMLAGLGMIVWNPLILAFDPSFQLSFLATLGLIFLSSRLDTFFAPITRIFGIRETLVATLSTQVLVLPYLLWFSGKVSILAPLTNVLVLVTVPYAMALGFFTGIVGLFNFSFLSPIVFVLGTLTWALLRYEIGVVTFFSSLPFSAVSIPAFPFVLVVIVYALFALYAVLYASKREETVPQLSAFR